ncbi:zinc finger and SCAN domain-containing protein 21-like [Clupea harengus]|uniref:Zinc finger and SCAN domain-containing protein 21-like n=1 Tax=Clupea harengus TaxID=7950 RepID=A0A6P8EUM4_CLUHA|nr:zinc finger and SCAN domain-containing protein 21-like [Clupea harengus]
MMATQEDFQRQFTSIMENLLHSAVSETTKLFENAVQEMKAEVVRIRKQNDNIKVTSALVEQSCSPCLQHGENNEGRNSPPDPDGNQQFTLLFIKQEEADLYDHTPSCLFPLAEDESKPFVVQQIETPVLSQEADPSPSDKTSAPFTHNPTPSPPQSAQEPAPSASVGTSQIQEFNPLDSLHVSLDLMPDIQEEKPVMLLQPPTPISTDAADGSMSATPNEPATPKTEQVDCEIDQQSLRSHPATHHDQPRRTSPRKSKSKYCCVVAQPQAKNVLQENDDDDSTAQKRQAVVTLTHQQSLRSHPVTPHDQPKRTSTRQSKYRCLLGVEAPQPNAQDIQQSNETSVPKNVHKETGKNSSKQPDKDKPGKNHRHKNQCEVCGRILSSASSLEHHQRVHRGERPFVCDMCGKSFPDGKGLRRHLLIHTAGKRHQCLECGKMFVYLFHLTSHQVTHTGQRPFPCNVCEKHFSSKATLANHTRLHTGEKPFGCTLCGRTFTHRISFNTHMQRHRGERRYVCLTCNKRFMDPNNLKAHKRIHTGERPYQCKMCGKRFIQSAHLKKHAKTQH